MNVYTKTDDRVVLYDEYTGKYLQYTQRNTHTGRHHDFDFVDSFYDATMFNGFNPLMEIPYQYRKDYEHMVFKKVVVVTQYTLLD